MKRIFNILFTIVAGIFLFTSCETDRGVLPVLDSDVLSKPVINMAFESSYIIDADNLALPFANLNGINITPAVYSTDVPVLNQIEISTSADFSANSALVGSPTSSDTIVVLNKDMNSALTSLGLTPNEEGVIFLHVKTVVSANTGSPSTQLLPSYSDAVSFNITPYQPQPAWIYSPGAYNSWDPASSEALCSITDNGIYVGYINFPEAGSEFKFTKDKSWDTNWGSSDGATLTLNGDNITSPGAGYYQITVNLNTLTFAMKPYSWGIIGDATPGGWDTDTDMTWNAANQRWEVTAPLIAGTFKVRLNHDWGTNYGITQGVVTAGGDNISVGAAGTYLVTFDEANLVITWTLQ